jgi:hypothetical protein
VGSREAVTSRQSVERMTRCLPDRATARPPCDAAAMMCSSVAVFSQIWAMSGIGPGVLILAPAPYPRAPRYGPCCSMRARWWWQLPPLPPLLPSRSAIAAAIPPFSTPGAISICLSAEQLLRAAWC